MEYKTIKVRLWNIGSKVVSSVTDFRITQDREYEVIKIDPLSFNNCFYIVNDDGCEEEYSEDWFRMKTEN